MYVQSGLKIGKIPLNYENLSMQLLNLLEDLVPANIQSRAEKQNKIIGVFCFVLELKRIVGRNALINVVNLVVVMLLIIFHQHVFTLNVCLMIYASQSMLSTVISMTKRYF